MSKQEPDLRPYWENMNAGRYYVKGEHDHPTWHEAVLASSKGNYFGPDACYWGFIPKLPPGTYYITGDTVNEQ